MVSLLEPSEANKVAAIVRILEETFKSANSVACYALVESEGSSRIVSAINKEGLRDYYTNVVISAILDESLIPKAPRQVELVNTAYYAHAYAAISQIAEEMQARVVTVVDDSMWAPIVWFHNTSYLDARNILIMVSDEESNNED